MEYQITPEPSPEEREALLAALERLLAEEDGPVQPAAYRSEWWRTGVLENVEESAEE